MRSAVLKIFKFFTFENTGHTRLETRVDSLGGHIKVDFSDGLRRDITFSRETIFRSLVRAEAEVHFHQLPTLHIGTLGKSRDNAL